MDLVLWKDKETGSKYFDALGKWFGFENYKFLKVLHDHQMKKDLNLTLGAITKDLNNRDGMFSD